jgi:Dihydrodipicolinate synthase/N-acetylneuraminate lyase
MRTTDLRQHIRERFSRYFTVVYTPFLAGGDIDFEGLRHNVEVTLGLPGVGGLSVHSIHQEFWTMTLSERRQVTEVVLETVNGRVPTIVGVSDTSTENVVELAKHASRSGADAVMIWPPYYGVRTPEGVQRFYELIAAQIACGFFVYSTTLTELGFYLNPDMVEALLPIENLVGVQNTTMDFSAYAAMMERVGRNIAVSTSLEEYFLFGKMVYPDMAPNFLMGSSRPLLVQNHDRPRCAEFIDGALAGNLTGAAASLREIVSIARQLQSRYFARGFHHLGLSKALSEHLGLKGGCMRPPASTATADELDECHNIMRAAGLL